MKRSILAVSSMIFIASVSQETLSSDYCASDPTELQAALDFAEGNGEDDTINIVQGAYAGNFVYASATENLWK